jgi:hypothetical protein
VNICAIAVRSAQNPSPAPASRHTPRYGVGDQRRADLADVAVADVFRVQDLDGELDQLRVRNVVAHLRSSLAPLSGRTPGRR